MIFWSKSLRKIILEQFKASVFKSEMTSNSITQVLGKSLQSFYIFVSLFVKCSVYIIGCWEDKVQIEY